MTKKVADYRNDHSVLDFIFAEFAVGLLLSHSLSFQIVDLSIGESLGPDKRGELCIKGPQVMLSYKDLPEQTAETLDSDGWLHTGKCNTSYNIYIPYNALPISCSSFCPSKSQKKPIAPTLKQVIGVVREFEGFTYKVVVVSAISLL